MYSAIDIAKYIVDYAVKKSSPVSNLKLQKILYFLWIQYYKKTVENLFNDEFCAWQLGPVVPAAYYEFCSYAGTSIISNFNVELQKKDEDIVNSIIDQYLNKSASSLVNKSHHNGGAWDEVFKNGQGNRATIPFRLIIDLEC